MAQVYQETAGRPLSNESAGPFAGDRDEIGDEPGNSRAVDAPMSAEEFERQHPAMLGAVQNVVHREMKLSSMNDKRYVSGDIQRLLDLQLVVTYIPLVLGYALHGISQRDQCPLSVPNCAASRASFAESIGSRCIPSPRFFVWVPSFSHSVIALNSRRSLEKSRDEKVLLA